MSPKRQRLSLLVTGGFFFAVVAPWVAVIVPVFPLMLVAYAGMKSSLVALALPFVLGSAPGFIAGLLFVIVTSRILIHRPLANRQVATIGGYLCALCFVAWFLFISFSTNGIHSIRDFFVVLVPAFMFSIFAAVGGALTALLFRRFVLRVGAWPETLLGSK